MPNPIQLIHPKNIKQLTVQLQDMLKSRLWLKIIVAMFLGIAVGMLLGPSTGLVGRETAITVGNWLALPGKIFLGLIQMIVVPLVFASVVLGIAAGEDMEHLRKTGLRVVAFFIATTTLAIIIGLGAAMLVQPGQYIDTSPAAPAVETAAPQLSEEEVEAPSISQVPDFIAEILPRNPLGAMVDNQMLQVVLFAVIFGLALVAMAPAQSKPLLDFLGATQEVTMIVVRWSMVLAPVAVFGLLAQTTMQTGLDALLGMTVYVLTVLGGLLVMLLVYMLIITLSIKKSPWWFLGAVREVQLLAFSTSSSAAVMPLSIQVAEDKLGVKPSVSQFVIPLGATINMNGTALYQGVATVFLAQVYDVHLSVASLLLIIVTAVGASIGTPATPGVGIVILAMVLNSAGVPAAGIALLLGVDRILDMSRTAINVTGDLTACLVMNRLSESKQPANGEDSKVEPR